MAFIVLEGLDGSGKSTQVDMLRKYFAQKNILLHFIHFPRYDEGIFGNLIARFLKGEFGSNEEVNPYLVSLLYAGDRHGAKKQIMEHTKAGEIVLVDRYVYSNMAYQRAKVSTIEEKKKITEWIRNLEYEHYGIPVPDISLFLDVPLDFAKNNLFQNRIGGDRQYLEGKKDIHEQNISFQETVRTEYLELVKTEKKFHSVACSEGKNIMASKEAIFERIIKKIKTIHLV